MGKWSKYASKKHPRKTLYKFDGQPVRKELVPNSIQEALQTLDEVEDRGTTSHPAASATPSNNQPAATQPQAAAEDDDSDNDEDPAGIPTIAEQQAARAGKDHVCIFCGAPATRKRIVNTVIVDLCQDDYETNNIGKIAQKLRESGNDTAKKLTAAARSSRL